ncbi:MAG: NADH-ubiquinone oxidoreductase-F iron-sulfur binding region domain-containing protein [Nitriliruptor sp.]|uniref:NADH-ubiquinone oxidoreductase-F iron-sulfur binding region domain-containing protein n=1 Tax=Nitriliruptor sp. TaxID=2448056 RepID=UPI0034A02046
MEPDEVIAEVADAGLRGRGGAGFPTATKWRSVRDAAAETESAPRLVVNGAEGEPGTYKDRRLLETNPFLVLEGMLIARHAIGADQVHLGVKAKTSQAALLHAALHAMVRAGWEDADVMHIVQGPDEYLFGEETGLLEVIEGNLPMPRWLPPFQHGLFATTGQPHPTVVNNVETLANVPFILNKGATAFRRLGTVDSPGTMLFTVVGDVTSPGVYELPLGTPLRQLLVDIAGAEDIKAIFSGVSSPVISPDRLDTPLTYEDMRTAGTGLGSGGFIVYDHRHCIVRVAAQLSHFLAIESCGQCSACKLGCAAITDLLRRVEAGEGSAHDLEAIADRIPMITDQTRCALPAGEQLLVGSLLDTFRDEFVAHLGRTCDAPVLEQVPKIESLDDATGMFAYDPHYARKRSDWSYASTGAR